MTASKHSANEKPTSPPASAHRRTRRPDGAALARLADQLEAIVADENPVQVHDRRRIIPTYRIPGAVRAQYLVRWAVLGSNQ